MEKEKKDSYRRTYAVSNYSELRDMYAESDGNDSYDRGLQRIGHLADMYAGAAGCYGNSQVGQIFAEGRPGSEWNYCTRTKEKIDKNSSGEKYAGLKSGRRTQERMDVKRAWHGLPMQKSTVAEVVYGKDRDRCGGNGQGLMQEFESAAGTSVRVRRLGDQSRPSDQSRLVCSKRCFNDLPNTKGHLNQLVHDHVTCSRDLRKNEQCDQYFNSLYGQAAGVSNRFAQDTERNAISEEPYDAVFFVH